MTGRLRRLSGPALIGDHDTRIERLERRLKTKQTDAARRPSFGLPTISLRTPSGEVITAGGNRIVEWSDPAANNLTTFNVGGFFTWVAPDTITVPVGCWVMGVADLRWASAAAGKRRIEVSGLADRNPSDTAYSVLGDDQNTTVPFWGYLPAGPDGLLVRAQHDEAGSQGLTDGNWSVTLLYR